MDIKKQVSKITANPLGLVAGAGVAFLATKKFYKGDKKIVLIGATVLGGILGALWQAARKAKKGADAIAPAAKK